MEVRSLRSAADELRQLGVHVLGISTDDVQAQSAFHKQEKLTYPLLSDPDASASLKYNVLMAKHPMAKRVSFLIDPKGKVRHIMKSVNVSTHGNDVLAAWRELQE